MKKPNFFIVGAPKCGTTALYTYLLSHPRIFMPRQKEPHFFSQDLHTGGGDIRTLEEYLRLFMRANKYHIAIGEASVLYMFSSVAIPQIREFNPDAKLIVMVRNPIDMIQSYHNQVVFSLHENEVDFEKAWRLQGERRRSESIPPTCENPKFLFYSDVAKLGEQVEKISESFPPEQVKIILFDDFRSSTLSSYKDVLEFLSVPYDGRKRFPQVNPSKDYRLRFLARALFKPPSLLVALLGGLKKMLGVRSLGWGTALKKIVTKKVDRGPISADLRRELVEEFRGDVALLSRQLGRDLNHWLE